MYRAELADGALRLIHGTAVLADRIRPVVALAGHAPAQVGLSELTEEPGADQGGAHVRYSARAQVGERKVWVTLAVRCYEAALVVDLGLEVATPWYEARETTLEAEGGLRLEFECLPQAETAMANYLHKEWWSRPWFGAAAGQERTAGWLGGLPGRTQSLVWQREGGLWVHALPVCAGDTKAELRGRDGSGLELTVSTYAEAIGAMPLTAVLAMAAGPNPFTISVAATSTGLAASGAPGPGRQVREYPEPFEYLGWCTWDAFYHKVNADGVLAKAAEFAQKGVPVKWMIIDDGWLSTAGNSQLESFEADPTKFPGGLAPTIGELKREWGVKWVAVWHAFSGYWNGLLPGGKLAQSCAELLHTTGAGRLLPAPSPALAFTFWDRWHSGLRAEGVDFVKVDYQSSVMKHYRGALPAARVARGSHAGLEASVGKSFAGRMINCMGMASENLWSRPMSAISRCSDDFFPKEADSVSEHALQNVYNSFYTAGFIWGDWDMWWSDPAQGVNHGVLRALSGGPVYVSDALGSTDPTKILPLITSGGRVLRCDQPGLPTADCLSVDVGSARRPLKVWNRAGDTGYVGLFNVDLAQTGTPARGTLKPSDVDSLAGRAFVAYDHFGHSARVLAGGEELEVEVPSAGVALYTIAPVCGGLAVLGLVDKYIGMAAAAVKSVTTYQGGATLVLGDGGQLGLATLGQEPIVTVNGARAALQATAGEGCTLWTTAVTVVSTGGDLEATAAVTVTL